MYYSTYHYKITPVQNNTPKPTWIFLPGGPGLGSEYLKALALFLDLPGTTLLADFPKDGTNNQGMLNLSYWKKGLIDLVQSVPDAILVAHSFSGMFVLDTPELEPFIKGLVLMNTSTHNNFVTQVQHMQQQHQLPDLAPAAAAYHLNPSQKTYQAFWQSYAHYCFTEEELALGKALFPLFAFNHEAYHYALLHFYPDYQCHWYPKIPTLTIAGEYDYLCPPQTGHEHIITSAGHFPWLVHKEQVKQCFMGFILRAVIKCGFLTR